MMRTLAPALAIVLALAASLALGNVAGAVEPGEMLTNPQLEARARTISEELRCMVCQNESIDDSHAELAKDIRLLVRRRLLAGDSNQAIRDYLVARYGDFILLKPPFELGTVLLWGMPVIVLALGGLGMLVAARRRGTPGEEAMRPLDPAERRRLEQLLGDAPAGPDANIPGRA